MKHPNHYIHIATGIRKVREAENRAYNIYAAEYDEWAWFVTPTETKVEMYSFF